MEYQEYMNQLNCARASGATDAEIDAIKRAHDEAAEWRDDEEQDEIDYAV